MNNRYTILFQESKLYVTISTAVYVLKVIDYASVDIELCHSGSLACIAIWIMLNNPGVHCVGRTLQLLNEWPIYSCCKVNSSTVNKIL